jgi:chromosome partitioning protein
MAVSQTCTVCATPFEVHFRYQTEDRGGGFSYYCSQKCLETSQRAGGDGSVTCDACATRFQVELVSQVVYVKGARKYACGIDCRSQLVAEAKGLRLGDLAAAAVVDQTNAATSAGFLREGSEAPKSVPPPAPGQVVPVVPGPKVTRAASAVQSMGDDLPRRIAIFNHKGGTGKTTTSVSIAAGLAMRGKKVLLVDTDAQGNVGVSLGVKSERTLYHVLVMGLSGKDAVTNVRENLDVLPSNETLAAAELYLAGRQNRDRVLASRLAGMLDSYDHVIVDCSPSLSLMNQNALCVVDSVLVPVACDYLSLVGMRQVIKTVKSVNQLLHHQVRIWGILPTFFDARAKICHEAVDTLKQHFGERCLRPVRQAIKIKEAPAQGQTLFEYAPGSSAADDYAYVVDRILGLAKADDQGAAESARASA